MVPALRFLVLLCMVSSVLQPATAWGASGNPLRGDSDQWRFTLAFPMIWAPDIDVRIRGDRRDDFTIEFEDIVSGLDFGLMGELYATRGPFGLALRVNYMELGGERANLEGVFDTTLKVDLTAGINDLLASWQVHEKVRLLTGVRHVHNEMVLHLESRIGDAEIINERVKVSDEDAFDFLIGMSFDHWFTDRWGLMLNADVALFGDNDRDYSAEFRGLYRFGSLNNVWFGYRYLRIGNDTSTDDLESQLDTTQHGPMLGWAFTF